MNIIQVSFILVVCVSVILQEVKGNQGHEFVQTLKRRLRSTCFCAENECCSKWGYCGKTDPYCAEGCKSGPCKTSSHTTLHDSFDITPDTFACIFSKIDTNLRARRFKGLTEAMEQMKWKATNNIEAAIFLSHVSHETDGLKTLVEYCSRQGTCDNYQSSWCSIQALPNIKYFGRGWFQLSYPCNYYKAGKALDHDLLNNPDLISQSDKIAASTAIWYFKETGMNALAQQGHFNETTRKLNEYECSGKAGYHMQAARVETYHKVRKCFGLPETTTHTIC